MAEADAAVEVDADAKGEAAGKANGKANNFFIFNQSFCG